MTLDRLYTDIWRLGLITAPIAHALDPAAFAAAPVVWLPARGPRAYAADPFGFVHDGLLTVFVEHYDYTDRHGAIAAYRFDKDHRLLETREVLREPWHLSYPQIFAHDGAIFMLPEAAQSQRLTLYQAQDFPWVWCVHSVVLDAPVVDATLFEHDGLWWLSASPPGRPSVTTQLLYVSDNPLGPWRAHPANPVLIDRSRARPGGAAFHRDGVLYLPGQDCRHTYGGALTLNRVDILTTERFASTPAAVLDAKLWRTEFQDGLHHLAPAGPQHTLIDVKNRQFTPATGVWRTLMRK